MFVDLDLHTIDCWVTYVITQPLLCIEIPRSTFLRKSSLKIPSLLLPFVASVANICHVVGWSVMKEKFSDSSTSESMFVEMVSARFGEPRH